MNPAPVLVERRIAASPSAVFEFLVDPDLLGTWFGSDCTLQPEPGGLFEMRSPNGMTARGEVVEVVTGQKVAFTWGWNEHPGVPPGSTLVEIELIPDGEGTLVRLTHSDLAAGETALHRKGWNHYLERLSEAVGGGDPGLDPGAG